MSRWVMAAVVAAVLAAAVVAVAGDREATAPTATGTVTATPGMPSGETKPAITAAGIDEHLDALQAIADDHGGTRAAGTPGDAATVEYLVAQLEQAGWEVETPSFRLPVFVERPGSPRVSTDGRRVRDVRTLSYSGSGDVTAHVRPLDLDLGHESDSGCRMADFEALHKGETALVQRGTCFLAIKARNAQRAGAAAVLIANDGVDGQTRAFPGTLVEPGLRIPALGIATAAAPRLADRVATVRVDAISKRATMRNVIAVSPGAAGAERVVMAGAHLDSVTVGPGINDDGSGLAALLEAAEALKDEPVRLGFWAAEELGLHGSRRYVRSLSPDERRRIAAYVNLDMVGTPGGRGEVYGTGDVDDALRRAGRLGSTDIGGSSDHSPFQQAGVPVGGIYTGTHPCYHQACDTAARVNRPLTRRMARVATTAIAALASPNPS